MPWTFAQFLSYGAIGVGLAIAILAARLLQKENLVGGTRLLFFGCFLVLVGAALEVFRSEQQISYNQQLIAQTENLPEGFFEDFLTTRSSKAVHLAVATDERFEDALPEAVPRSIKVRLAHNECKYYFAASKPPAKVSISIKSKDVDESNVSYHGYYQSGKICNLLSSETKDFDIELSLLHAGGQSTLGAYLAPPYIDTVAAVPTSIEEDKVGPRASKASASVAPANDAEKGKAQAETAPAKSTATSAQIVSSRYVVCRGEYEQNCAGIHDVYRACDAPEGDALGAQLCGRAAYRLVLLNSKAGNHCGYALTEVLCH